MTRPALGGVPLGIAKLISAPVAEGSRDETAFRLALLCERHHLLMAVREELAEVLHEQMEQPRGDEYTLDLVLEKVYRLAGQGEQGPRADFDLESPAKWQIVRGDAWPDTSLMTKADAAQTYLGIGISVVPLCWADETGACHAPGKNHGPRCHSPGKAPLVRWSEFQRRLPSEAEVADWWHRWPDANIGGITGSVSRLLVLDFDRREELLEHPQFAWWSMTTPIAQTSRGGHVYVRLAADHTPIASFKRGHVDVQAEGKLVVMPPSVHASGADYAWIDQAEGSMIHVLAGGTRFAVEAVTASEAVFSIVHRNPYAPLPESVLSQLRSFDADGAMRVGECGVSWRWWKDDAGHRVLIPDRCSHRACPRRARQRARIYIEAHEELFKKMVEANLLHVPVGERYWVTETRRRELASWLKKLRIPGDLAVLPTGAVDGEGEPVFDVVGIVSLAGVERSSIEKMRSQAVVQRVADAAASMFYVVWSAYSGAQLYENPELWERWFHQVRARHLVRGVDDGRRVPKAPRGQQKHCPLCGSVLHRIGGLATTFDIELMLAKGKIREVGHVYVAVEAPQRATGPPRDQGRLFEPGDNVLTSG